MKVKKDSLVLKIIFYNNVGIILSTILLSFILIFSDYTTREEEFKKNSVEKMKLLEKAYKNNFNEMRDEIRKILSEVYLVEKFNSTLDKEVYKKYSEDIMEKLLKKDIENYYHSAVTITDSKGEILSEVGIKAVGDELWLKKDSFLEKIKEAGGHCYELLTLFWYHRKSMNELSEVFGYSNADNTKNQKARCQKRLEKLTFELMNN